MFPSLSLQMPQLTKKLEGLGQQEGLPLPALNMQSLLQLPQVTQITAIPSIRLPQFPIFAGWGMGTLEEAILWFLSWMTSNNSLWASVSSSVSGHKNKHLRVVGRIQCSRQKKCLAQNKLSTNIRAVNYLSRNICQTGNISLRKLHRRQLSS